jgi:APA family basic amino acid/polyamine antiporter
MVGAGVFYVWAPAASRAGNWLLVALALAGAIALLNALSSAQLALHNPVSGGAYSFARRYVSPRVGFLAGWLFLAGKTASAGAIALVAARYLAPDYAPLIAAVLIAVFAAINVTGIRTTAGLSFVLAAVVVITLVAVAGVGLTGSPVAPTDIDFSGWGVLQAAGLLFFAFAGYARMATLGEEVNNPRKVLPRVIVGTLLGVLVLYALVAWALVNQLGVVALATSVAPVADLVPGSFVPLVSGVAVIASLGSLLTVLAALSRVSLAMARDRMLPGALAVVWSRTGSPASAELTMAVIAMVGVVILDPVWLIGASSGSVLLYYAIAHWSALRQPAGERVIWRVVPWLGLVGCLVLVVLLPGPSVVTTAVLVITGFLVWQALAWREKNFPHKNAS